MRGLKPVALAVVLIGSSVAGCIEVGEPDLDGDVLVIGDSLLDYHAPDADVGTVAGERLGLEVDMLASGGASMLCLLYTSPSPRDLAVSRMPSSA